MVIVLEIDLVIDKVGLLQVTEKVIALHSFCNKTNSGLVVVIEAVNVLV